MLVVKMHRYFEVYRLSVRTAQTGLRQNRFKLLTSFDHSFQVLQKSTVIRLQDPNR